MDYVKFKVRQLQRYVNSIEEDWDSILIDFEYTKNTNKTAIITGWKQTLNGVPSTELVIPDVSGIIL